MPHDKQDRDTEEIEDEGKNIILGIVSQLRPNMDLSKVTLPTFVLEPRSMLERITNFMSHPDFLLPVPHVPSAEERFLEVCRFYLSGWHIRPPGVKKPLNPVLGETFTGFWKFPPSDIQSPGLNNLNGVAVYIAEQVSHHPPISAYFYYCPQYKVRIDGVLKPRSRFLGNSAASIMEGVASIKFLEQNEEYLLTQPNMYARGILFGKMRIELGDHVTVRCPDTDLAADIEFKVKGFISGTYNSIAGKVKRISTGDVLYKLSGKWDSEIVLENVSTGKTSTFLDVTELPVYPVMARPLEEQTIYESQKLWHETCEAVNARDQSVATKSKTAIEDHQREKARAREANNEKWQPKYFKQTGPEEYVLDMDIPYEKSDAEVLCSLDDRIPIFSENDRAYYRSLIGRGSKSEPAAQGNEPHKHVRDNGRTRLNENRPHHLRDGSNPASSFVTYRSENGSVDEYHDAQLPDQGVLSQLEEN
ncbi:oxysterol binding protein [Schizosaccharomyces cryophilus OY26]|uniref:Oxysterol binding protein n=1 Tax=Schizosaccharomyces cryophilus (strain OY26 / ATCC MYA-4695 / CBS 11777 / NBRC 106824 / NRRL Y48691) TaxID=653667 RepID=S9X0V2_SCHCR|nr:oxysterol binding protein [Schizosaccharomyces cryophilus OY26]EPY50622.1 oxysterol binding protein [Schizosaccharomyces cryophilus OY26]